MYEVDRLLARRPGYVKGTWEYLVLWKGWSRKQATWEHEKDISDKLVHDWDAVFPRPCWEYPRSGRQRATQIVRGEVIEDAEELVEDQ